ncbi:MAG: 2-oxoglutarate dehydrogenase complex dihydrolipoyllysine-residue succinyltransferase [Rickettsiales bacterium]
MSDIKVPALGESVTEATVGSWHKKVGEEVKADELLVELETDKITLEVNAESNGVLGSISAEEGSTVAVGDVLGSIKEGEAGKKLDAKPADESAEETQEEESTKEEKETKDTEDSKVTNDSPKKRTASPAADRIAKEKNIDVNKIDGSGKDGRITKGDVLGQGAAEKGAVGSVTANKGSNRATEAVKMTKLRQRIAQRLKESQNTAAILTTFNEVDMSRVMGMRKKFKDKFLEKHNVKLGFMSFFVKAATAALQEIPGVNAQINNDEVIYHKYCDISIAVGTDKGLVVPVLRNAEKLSFAEIEKGIVALAKKARDGKLTMEDLTGGTFSITNGGIYGSLLSTPIINPPQSAILGMHSINERPVVENGEIVVRPIMNLALSYDHRIIDGKEAVTFLVKIKEFLEHPENLLLEI